MQGRQAPNLERQESPDGGSGLFPLFLARVRCGSKIPPLFIARNRYKRSRSDQFSPNFIELTLVLEFGASVNLQLREYVRKMEIRRALLDFQNFRNFLV